MITDSDRTASKCSLGESGARQARAGGCRAQTFTSIPQSKIAVTGITGTNGKSTTAFLLESIFQAADRKSALIGTIEYHVGGKVLPAPHTTPEALELQRLFRDELDAGGTEAVMEVSSHALAQERTYGIPFDVAVFTNLTRDHLDYHGTMEEYFCRQADFVFRLRHPCRREWRCSMRTTTTDCSSKNLARMQVPRSSLMRLQALISMPPSWKSALRGTSFQLVTPDDTIAVTSPLIGRVNVYNILAASAAAYARGCPAEAIADGIAKLARVPGRFERVDCAQPFTVVVDYAHTDDALRNLTSLAREFVKQDGGRVITMFGCGGDRDRSKRPLMGEAAGKGSDFVVLTSDNPRNENPLAIINDAVVGVQRSGVKYTIESDRTSGDSDCTFTRPPERHCVAGRQRA